MAAHASDYSDAYVYCRSRSRHTIERIDDDGGIRRQWVESKSVRRLAHICVICGAIRYEAWNAITGDILFVSYKYPPGYKAAGLKPKNFRKEYLAREFSTNGKKKTKVKV